MIQFNSKKVVGEIKMLKTNKAITAILSTIILLGMTACGQLNEKISYTKAYQTEEDEPVTLKWVVFGEKYKDSEKVFEVFNKELQNLLPNTTIEFEIINTTEYKEKWDIKMATNEKVDLAWTGSMFTYSEEVKKGSFLALDYLIQTYGQDMCKEVPDYMFEKQKVDGKIYSIPIYGDACSRGYAVKVSKEVAQKYGDINQVGLINRKNMYTTKECYDAFEAFLSGAKAAGKIGTGISHRTFRWMPDKGYEGINGEESPFVYQYFDKDLKVYNKYELESYKTYYSVVADWYQKGYIREDVLSVQNPRANDLQENGNIFYIDGYAQNASKESSIIAGYDIVCEPLDGYKYIPFSANKNATVIPRTSENPKRAMQLINLLNSKKGEKLFKLLANGVENRHYIKIGDNIIKRIIDDKRNFLYVLPQYVIGSVFNDYETTTGDLESLKKFNEKALVSPLTGFELDTRLIITELAQVDIVVSEYHELLSSGALEDWVIAYDEFIKKMKKAGSDKIVQEIQKQLNAYQKENSLKIEAYQKVNENSWKSLQSSDDKYIYEDFYIDPR